MWTQFMDMHSGGETNTQWEYIYVEAPNEKEARRIFAERTGQDSYAVNCDCCGSNYSVSDGTSLEQASGYERNCESDAEGDYLERQDSSKSFWGEGGEYIPLAEYEKLDSVLIIRCPK